MKKYFKVLLLLSVFLFCALALSGCGHYDRREAAEWFKENIADERIAVSRDYTERKNEEGYTDRVWNAHLAALPEVEFELISVAGYSLFPSYTMETTYHLEMGRYYLSRYGNDHSGTLDQLEITESGADYCLRINGIYDTTAEISTICRQIGALDDYIGVQKYPCMIQCGLAYREPLTYLVGNRTDKAASRSSYVWETGGTVQETHSAKSKATGMLSDTLQRKAKRAFAEYAAIYRVSMEQFTEEELRDAVNADSDHRFTVTRPDGMQLCYPELILMYFDQMSFGTLYEVLLREGSFQAEGTPNSFTFTSVSGAQCSFSYSYQKTSGNGNSACFYYVLDDTEVMLTDEALINDELFTELTGLTFAPISQ